MADAVAYISIGNSDDKLSQAHWARFVQRVDYAVQVTSEGPGGAVHGRWLSAPDSPWQNACWALQLPSDPRHAVRLQGILAVLAVEYRQDAIAWAVAPDTQFIGPN